MKLERLNNGAFVMQECGDLVLAIWPTKIQPFVVWRRDAHKPSEVHGGDYHATYPLAYASFQERAGNFMCPSCKKVNMDNNGPTDVIETIRTPVTLTEIIKCPTCKLQVRRVFTLHSIQEN